MQRIKLEEYAVGGGLVAVGAAVIFASNFGERTASQLMSGTTLGPSFFPSVVGLALIILGLLHILVTRARTDFSEEKEYHGAPIVLIGTLIAGAVFMPIALYLGIMVASAGALALFLYFTGYRPLWAIAPWSIGTAVTLQLLLVVVLQIPMPKPLLI